MSVRPYRSDSLTGQAPALLCGSGMRVTVASDVLRATADPAMFHLFDAESGERLA